MGAIGFQQNILPTTAIPLGFAAVASATTYSAGVSYTTGAAVSVSGQGMYAVMQSVPVSTPPSPTTSAPWIMVDPTSGVPLACKVVVAQAEGAAFRYRLDGGIPTASIGCILPTSLALDTSLVLVQNNGTPLSVDFRNVKLIQSAAGKLNVQYFG